MLKIIEKAIESVHEELEGAKEYAEKFIENKAIGNMARANKFKEMASDELRHASYMHEFAAMDIAAIEKVMPISGEDEEHWEKSKKKYAECMAWIRKMLE